MIGRCHRLWEYSEFVSEVQEQIRRGKKTEEAIQLAMDYCVEHDILKDILMKQRTEVLHMLLTEFDEKKYKRTIYSEGYEDGELAGYSKGEQVGYSKGEQAGYSKGEAEGANKKLGSQVAKKLQKGKSIEQIAEELEEEAGTIQIIADQILKKEEKQDR